MNLRTLLSLLMVYRSNFHVLHWNAKGDKFDTIHDKAADYYEKMLLDADKVAEMVMRLGQNCVNYPEAYELLKSIENKDFVILASDVRYKFTDFVKFTDMMFKDITSMIEQILSTEELQNPSNVGIKASLEGIHDEYDLQRRYINASRVEE